MHIGGTQMAPALNMDERSDTTTQTDSMEEKEREEKQERRGRRKQRDGINKMEPQVAVFSQ